MYLSYYMSSLCHVLMLCNIVYTDIGWCVKDDAVYHSHQWLVAKWLGLGVRVS